MPGELERRAVQRLIAQADALGLGDQVPAEVWTLADGHGPTNGGAIRWSHLYPDDDAIRGCCWGEINNGAAYCLCWAPEFDVDQAVAVPPGDGEVRVRPGGMCGDCAYRPGSPEREHGFMDEALRDLPLKGQTFWCHDGLRRPARWRHPDGRVVDADPADYQPLMVAGRPHRADGRVGYLCAGWAACGRRWDNLLDKEGAPDRA